MEFRKGDIFIADYNGVKIYVQYTAENKFVGFGTDVEYNISDFTRLKPIFSEDKYTLYAIVLDSDVSSVSRIDLEGIENQRFDDIQQIKDSLILRTDELGTGDLKILPLTDFMDEYNNDEIQSNNSWFSYVWLRK
jgi:hypothetical protein